MTNVSLQLGGHRLWFWSRYVKRTGEVLSCAVTLRPYSVVGLIVMMTLPSWNEASRVFGMSIYISDVILYPSITRYWITASPKLISSKTLVIVSLPNFRSFVAVFIFLLPLPTPCKVGYTLFHSTALAFNMSLGGIFPHYDPRVSRCLLLCTFALSAPIFLKSFSLLICSVCDILSILL